MSEYNYIDLPSLREDWKDEVANDDTERSFPEWVTAHDHARGLEFWPDEDIPSFVRSIDTDDWTPVCMTCRAHMAFQAGWLTGEPSWFCTAERFSHPVTVLFAEDWPDYTEDDETDKPLSLGPVALLSGLTPDEVPTEVRDLVERIVTENPDMERLGWALSDHRHGYADEGGFMLALEGDYEWPTRVMQRLRMKGYEWPMLSTGPYSGWSLSITPKEED